MQLLNEAMQDSPLKFLKCRIGSLKIQVQYSKVQVKVYLSDI
jgi:hypothetical protein